MDGRGRSRPGVAAKLGELASVVGEGRWCEQQASLMRGFAYGVLEPGGERYSLARLHTSQCPACRAYVASLRGLAAAFPPQLLPGLAHLAGGKLALARSAADAHAGARAAGAGGGSGGALGAARAVGSGPGVGIAGAGGAGGAAGGGWLLAGGSLGAKFAAGCVLALSIGAGCAAIGVGLGDPGAGPHGRQKAASRAQDSRTATPARRRKQPRSRRAAPPPRTARAQTR